MTQQQREKLIYCTGLLSGLEWCVESDAIANALQTVQEDIDRMLKEDSDENEIDAVPVLRGKSCNT